MKTQELTGYPSIDKPWMKWYSLNDKDTSLPKSSVFQYIYDNNRDHMADTALLYFGKKISYHKFFAEINKVQKSLIANGVKQGDCITIGMPAIPETYYLILALNKIGACANLLNPTFSQEQMTERIKEANSSLYFTVNELYEHTASAARAAGIRRVISCSSINSLRKIVQKLKGVKDVPDAVSWNQFMRMGTACQVDCTAVYTPDCPAIMVYSSGTTGASKGIVHTNESINSIIHQYELSNFQIQPGNKYFAQIPIWFSTGIIVTMLTPLRYGVTVIPCPIFDFDTFFELIEKYKPNYMVAAGASLEYFATKYPKSKAIKYFKYLIAGGDYITGQTEQYINDWLATNGAETKLHKGYGMCECGGTVTSTTELCNKVGAAGIPMPQVTVSVFDVETNAELPYGERGELRVLTPGYMQKYYKNPEATKKYFYTDKNGVNWARTGDMGYLDEDGVVYVSGRINDSYINSDGERIYLFDIERAIVNHKLVKQCKAVCVKLNGIMTHVACVVLVENSTKPDSVLKHMQSECRNKLPETYIPTHFKLYMDALPVATSGKLDIPKMCMDIEDSGCIEL